MKKIYNTIFILIVGGFVFVPKISHAYNPPIGIPAPPFGIDQPASGAVTIVADATHRIPNPIPAGSVVEVRGTYAFDSTSPNGLNCAGTSTSPAYIRGAAGATITGAAEITGSYCIFENLTIKNYWTVKEPADHIAIRNSDISVGGLGINIYATGNVSNVVYYHNTVHDTGDWQVGQSGHPCYPQTNNTSLPNCDEDAHGTGLYRSADANGSMSYVWILDSTYYHNSGDAVQINGNTSAAAMNHIFVGGNTAHDNRQVGFWTKNARDIIFSQNTVYSMKPDCIFSAVSQAWECYGDGEGMGWQYNPTNVWFLYNHIYNTQGGGVHASSSDYIGSTIFYIGNLIHGIHTAGTYTLNPGWDSAGISDVGATDKYFINNTIYDVDSGITTLGNFPNHVENNIISNVAAAGVQLAIPLISDVYNNTFYQNGQNVKFQVDGTNYTGTTTLQSTFSDRMGSNQQVDPKFTSASNFHLQSGSPAIDKGADISSLASQYQAAFGASISFDLDNKPRPQGAAWDMGAYEFGSGATPTPLPGDLNLDHIVNSIDYSILNSKWFTNDSNADLNHDGLVNSLDYSILNGNWFKTW